MEMDTNLLQIINAEQAWHYKIFPISIADGVLTFCFAQDNDIQEENIKEELEMMLGKNIVLVKEDPIRLEEMLATYYRKTNGEETVQREMGKDEDVFLEQLISEAKSLGSSDLHLEPYEYHCRIRFRIDGMLVERYQLDKEKFPSLVNKIKIKANLDIAEKRLPQDGRIKFELSNKKFDIRVSSLPTLYGEKIVMRLLNDDTFDVQLNNLGLSEKDYDVYLESIRKPNGIVLISGPTGSGKTTTLYASLMVLNDKTKNILTIEDPIEYTLEGINQVQLKANIGLDFAKALKTFLRQDPDIIMVGEIRDKETASTAIRAALTGHLVLSTIHTNSALGTISRLIDMDIPPFLIADTLNVSVAQRLLRLLCENCKQVVPFNPDDYPSHFTPIEEIREHAIAKGCTKCYYTGYKGRSAVFEIVPVNKKNKEFIKAHEQDKIRHNHNYYTLSDNAFLLFKQQKTSLEEVYSLL